MEDPFRGTGSLIYRYWPISAPYSCGSRRRIDLWAISAGARRGGAAGPPRCKQHHTISANRSTAEPAGGIRAFSRVGGQVLDLWRCRFSISVLDRRSTIIVLQIQIQVLVNTLAPIIYWIFLKTSMIKWNFIFMKCILIHVLGNHCSIIEHKIFFWLFVTQASIFYFQIFHRVTCGTLVTPLQLSQNLLRQLQVTGCADLAAVSDRVAKTATENQIVSAKSDNRLLLSKTVLRQVWDRDRKRALITCCLAQRALRAWAS